MPWVDCADAAAHDDVAIGQDADDDVVAVEHGHEADVFVTHRSRDEREVIALADRADTTVHDFLAEHERDGCIARSSHILRTFCFCGKGMASKPCAPGACLAASGGMRNTGSNAKGSLLVIDDDAEAASALGRLLEAEGYQVTIAANGNEGLARVAERMPDVVVTDLEMPELDGMGVLAALRDKHPAMPVIVVTAVNETGGAVAAMRAGAEDYVRKPIDDDELLVTVERAIERTRVRAEADELRRQLHERDSQSTRGLVGATPAMQKVHALAHNAAPSLTTVLLVGETGTGKSALARVIHSLSDRAAQPFVSMDLRGTPAPSEADLRAHFERAAGGTLVLDEISALSPAMQAELLRIIQEKLFDVRLIVSTEKDLADEVRANRFREDLYYRLNVVEIDLPPLRLRAGDVLLLAEHFMRKVAFLNHKALDGFTDAAREKILRHDWPGNVRELESAVERAVMVCRGMRIDATDLPFDRSAQTALGVRVPGSTMADLEKYAILRTLEACGGSTTKTAEMLGISIRTIQYRLHQYGLRGPRNGTNAIAADAMKDERH